MTPLEGRVQKQNWPRHKRMTVKASSYIASIEAAAPALAVQAIIKMPFATRSTWLSWLDRLRLAAFLLVTRPPSRGSSRRSTTRWRFR